MSTKPPSDKALEAAISAARNAAPWADTEVTEQGASEYDWWWHIVAAALSAAYKVDRLASVADLVDALIAEGGEIRYRPNGDKLLVFKLADGRPPDPTLPEPEEPADV